MNSAEALRRINNLIAIGTVTESKSAEGIAMVRVQILNRVTDFLPVMQKANSYKKEAAPILPGEQVIVLHPYGNGDSGIVLGSIFNKGEKEPAGYSNSKEVTVYMDGTVISYDASSKVMEINAVGTINVTCKNANLVAENVTVNATAISVDATSVDITASTTNNGNVSISGNLDVTGNVSAAGSISDSKGSLTGHVHLGVTPGTAVTGTRP